MNRRAPTKLPLRPLDGMRVVEFGSDLAASYCARLLADQGATVVNILLSSDKGEAYPPLRSRLDVFLGAGKMRVRLDGRPDAQLILDVCRRSEALIVPDPEDFERLYGMCFKDLEILLPEQDIVIFTPEGMEAALDGRASAPLTVDHGSGFAWHQSNPTFDVQNVPPYGTALHEAYFGTGVLGASAVLAARRKRTMGHGRSIVEVSVRDFLGQFLIEQISDYARGVRDFGRRPSSGDRQVAGGLVFILKCLDGWLLVSPREDHQWVRWMEALGNPAFASDEALCGGRDRRIQNAAELQTLMAAEAANRTRAELFAKARALRVPCFPLNTPRDVKTDPQLHAREFFDVLETAGDQVQVPGLPFSITTADGRTLNKSRRLASAQEIGLKEALQCLDA